jgi:hypothetical protein
MGLNALHEGTWRETSVSALLRLLEYLHSEPNTEPRRLVHYRNLAETAKYASAFSAVLKDAFTPSSGTSCNRPRHRGPAAKQRAVRLGLSFAGDPRRFCRILFFSLRPISMILKSLQIRLQRSER